MEEQKQSIPGSLRLQQDEQQEILPGQAEEPGRGCWLQALKQLYDA